MRLRQRLRRLRLQNLMLNIDGLSKMSQTVTVSYVTYLISKQLKIEEQNFSALMLISVFF
jgi:hypothetical protein